MRTLWRILVVSSAVLMTAGAPAFAQETNPATPPAQNDVVGPPQLQNFSLDGRVTREADSPVQVQPRARQTPSEPGGQPAQASASRQPQPSRESTAAAARSDSPARDEPARSAATAAADLPAPISAERIASPAPGASEEAAVLSPQPAFVPAPADSSLDGSPAGVPMLPWLIAALALAGAAAWYFLRQRPRESYAGAGSIDRFEAPAPAQAPPVRRPPAAAAPKPDSPGIVSTRLRPWLEIEFKPQRAVVDEEKAAVAFELSVFNSGSAPARDVLLEASLFNAGPMQDEQIRLFFENPVAKGDRIRLIAPMQKVTVNTAVFMKRDQVRPLEIEGRQLFVPMVAFNVLYGWGRGEGQSSTSFLVGKATTGEKLAPFRLDQGPRVFRNLDSREHELRSRK